MKTYFGLGFLLISGCISSSSFAQGFQTDPGMPPSPKYQESPWKEKCQANPDWCAAKKAKFKAKCEANPERCAEIKERRREHREERREQAILSQ